MSRVLQFVPEADLELDEIQWWYEQQRPGLGLEFLRVFGSRLKDIRYLPESTALVALRTRRALLWPFPYFVLYTFSEREVLVTAIFHAHRDPRSWSDRVREPMLRDLYLCA